MFNDLTLNTKEVETTLFGKKLILKNIYKYEGPITLQYLPNGGIQMIYQNQMIINSNIGFVATREVEYNGINYTINELSKKHLNLVNLVLPN